MKELKQDAGKNMDTNDIICHKCWSSIYDLDFNYILSDVLENNKHIKKILQWNFISIIISFDSNLFYEYDFNNQIYLLL